MATTKEETITTLAKSIGSFSSWTQVGQRLIRLAALLDEKARDRTLEGRRQFVYGGLVALDEAYGWDQIHQGEETEQTILWMFTQLAIR